MAPHIQGVSLIADDFPTEDHYPFNLEVIRRTRRIDLGSPVTILVGENGSGKSTFLEALARRCGIHIWRSEYGARFKVNRHEKTLHQHMSVEWINGKVPGSFFGSDHFKDFTHQLDDWASMDPGQLKYFGGESLVTKSHGQSIMAFFRSRYAIPGLYLLDEPETALSPKTQLELRDLLVDCAGSGHAQFIVATHSPILVTTPSATVYSFDEVPAAPIDFRETPVFQVYLKFFTNTEW